MTILAAILGVFVGAGSIMFVADVYIMDDKPSFPALAIFFGGLLGLVLLFSGVEWFV